MTVRDKQKVLIVGSSGHSKVNMDIFEKCGNFEILGLLDSVRRSGETILGYKVLGNLDVLPDLLAAFPDTKLFIAIGDNWTRHLVHQNILQHVSDAAFATAIHPSAQIGKNARIGQGSCLMAGAVVNSDAIIEDFCIVNTCASLEHDCVMHRFSSIAPRAVVGGDVVVGEFSAVSMGATVLNRVSIGAHSVIGAGALLLNSVGDNIVAYGAPARPIRNRIVGENYLRRG